MEYVKSILQTRVDRSDKQSMRRAANELAISDRREWSNDFCKFHHDFECLDTEKF